MPEREPKGLLGEGITDPSSGIQSKPADASTGLGGFVDGILTAQGAPLTLANRESMQEIIGHIDAHRS